MWSELLLRLKRWVGGTSTLDQPESTSVEEQSVLIESQIPESCEALPYDESLMERSRTQWQFGDWDSLAKLERDIIQAHPDRAKLALLAAAGRIQLGFVGEARQYIRLAQDWGCSRRLVSQVLVSGAYNTLGKAYYLAGDSEKGLHSFQESVSIAAPQSDVRLLTQARANHQVHGLGIQVSVQSKEHIGLD